MQRVKPKRRIPDAPQLKLLRVTRPKRSAPRAGMLVIEATERNTREFIQNETGVITSEGVRIVYEREQEKARQRGEPTLLCPERLKTTYFEVEPAVVEMLARAAGYRPREPKARPDHTTRAIHHVEYHHGVEVHHTGFMRYLIIADKEKEQ